MRDTTTEIIDAEFRVIPASPLDAWKQQLPRTQERIGYVVAAGAGVVAVAGIFAGHMLAGFVVALALCGLAAMLTEDHRTKGLACFAMAIVLATSGCSQAPAPLAADHAQPAAAEVQESIREATRYRDPREGFTPKPLPVPGAADATAAGEE